jgi:hypothetical protein
MIPLAHTGGDASAGPAIEFLVLGAAAIITAVALFLQKNVHRAAPPVLLLIGIAAVVGAFATSGSETHAARVTIVEPKPGDEVPAGEPVELQIRVIDQPEGSHVHVFVDGALEQMPSGLTAAIILEEGPHEVSVELTDAEHGSLEPRVTDSIELVAR